MGLSGRKVKQRISADPRNLSWADDAARFGSNYLSKFGWDASKGLGAGGDGMKSHIKVSHKLDMLGIGAAQMKDPNGIAWKQNTDFENLLRRLNENLSTTENDVTSPQDVEMAQDGPSEAKSDAETGEKKKKRKHKEAEGEEDRTERKKKKKEAKAKEAEESTTEIVETTTSVVVETKKVVALPRHRAHRARAIAAKNISSKSSAHISEILGVAPDPYAAVAASVQGEVQGKLTSVTETDALGMEKLTTSTKSLADYFKDKLNARNGGVSSGTATPSASTSSFDEEERPRTGIGASRLLLEIQTETRVEEETQRVGLSKFSSLMSSSFLAATSMASFVPPQMDEPERVATEVARISEVESDSESEQKHKKSKKDKKKHKEVEGDATEKSKKKKSKKDKKGKGKAVDEEDTPTATDDVDEKPAKDQKSPSATGSTEDVDGDLKKEKRKHKKSTKSEESEKPKKEKKKHRNDS